MSAMQGNEQLWEQGAGPGANGVPLADWWRRAAAVVIDTAVLWIPLMFATHSMGRLGRTAVGLVVGIVYFSLLNGGARGQTLGKMVWNIRVRDAATGGPLGPVKAAVRYIVPAALASLIPILGLFVWLTDGLWPLWDRRRQALHDKVAGSIVVAAS
jgi:uncharacterized RDD family membrane protein YckC